MTPEEAMEQFIRPGGASPGAIKRGLTRGQQEVYDLRQQGKTAREIADELDKPIASVYDALSKCRSNGWIK